MSPPQLICLNAVFVAPLVVVHITITFQTLGSARLGCSGLMFRLGSVGCNRISCSARLGGSRFLFGSVRLGGRRGRLGSAAGAVAQAIILEPGSRLLSPENGTSEHHPNPSKGPIFSVQALSKPCPSLSKHPIFLSKHAPGGGFRPRNHSFSASKLSAQLT